MPPSYWLSSLGFIRVARTWGSLLLESKEIGGVVCRIPIAIKDFRELLYVKGFCKVSYVFEFVGHFYFENKVKSSP